MSAPASTHAHARSIAASRPSPARASVRAMIDEAGVGPGVDRRLDPVDHLAPRHELLPRPVAAALGAHLVFDVHRACAGLDHRPDGARDVERRGPESRVDVDQERQRADVGDPPHVGEHVVEIADAEIGEAERPGGDTAAREVDRLETGALSQDRVIRADRARDLQRPLGGDGRAKTGACRRRGHGCRRRVAASGVVTFGRWPHAANPAARRRPRALPRAPSASHPFSRARRRRSRGP